MSAENLKNDNLFFSYTTAMRFAKLNTSIAIIIGCELIDEEESIKINLAKNDYMTNEEVVDILEELVKNLKQKTK